MRACSPLQTIGGKVDVARHVPELDAALSVTTVAAGRLDVGEGGEIEIGEGLESLGSGCVAQAVGQPFRLAGEFHLRAKGDEEEGALAQWLAGLPKRDRFGGRLDTGGFRASDDVRTGSTAAARDHLRAHLAGSLKVATLRRRISAITAAHRIAGLGLGGATRGPTATSGAGVRAAAIPEDGPDADALRDAWTGRPE